MKKPYRLTKQGVADLESELKELKDQRGEIADKLKTAREFGDLSENAEYEAARNEQAHVESRIKEIEHILQNVELIEEPKAGNKVQLGTTVVLEADGKEQQFTIVGSVEADPSQSKISNESPIGKALVGKKVGDEVTVALPASNTVYKIKSIK